MPNEKPTDRIMSKTEIMAEMEQVCAVLSESEMLFCLDLIKSMVEPLGRLNKSEKSVD